MEYPELERLSKIEKDSNLCGQFLEWLQSKYYMIDKNEPREELFMPIGYSSHINIQELLAEYFDIDLEQVETEKRKLIKSLAE